MKSNLLGAKSNLLGATPFCKPFICNELETQKVTKRY